MEHVMAEANINVIVKRCKFSFSFIKALSSMVSHGHYIKVEI
jgi:hypothetical protein